MLNFKNKVKIFTSILDQEETSYADSFNAYIAIMSSNYDYEFLEKLDSEKNIESWITKLKSRIAMREDDALLEDIIDDYILCG
ncbi:MAG: hypothetical protein ABIC82_03045 [bacterium]